MNRSTSAPLSVAATAVVILAVWVAAAWLSHPGYELDADGQPVLVGGKPQPLGPVLVPGPWAVLRDLWDLLLHEGFLEDVAHSLQRILLGVIAAAIPAFILGMWFGTTPRVRAAANPLFAFVQYIPPTSFVPILILWLGIGLKQQVALLFLGTFFYLTIMVAETVAATPGAFREAALTLGVRPRQLFWKVIIPNGLPDFIGHVRIMLGIAWTYLTVAEMVAADNGIGRVIINSQRYLQTGRVLAGMLTIGVLGVISDLLLRQLSRWLCRWKEA
jgi:NitT/TauT family transport system permease protein